MSDYTKLIEWLRADVLCTYEEEKHMQGLAADAIEALQRACANYAEQVMEHEWISVKQQLPEDGSWQIFTDGENISVERYKMDAYDHFFPNGRWFDYEDATHWMPLPTPPKEDERC